jgi:hypothetical protein
MVNRGWSRASTPRFCERPVLTRVGFDAPLPGSVGLPESIAR